MQDRPTVSAYRPDTNSSNSAATTSGLAGHSNEERAGIRRRTTITTTTASSAGSEGLGASAAASVSSSALRVAPGMPWANVGLASTLAPTLPPHPASQEKAEAPSSGPPVTNLTERRLRQRQGEVSTGSSPSSMIPSSMSIFPLSGASAYADMEMEEEHNIAQGSDSMSVNQYLSSNTADAGYSSVSSTRKRPAHATQCDTDEFSDSHPGASSTSQEESAERKPSAQDNASPMEQSSINSGVVQVVEGTGSGTVDAESTRQREERVLARDTRLRCVVQELCPLIDRFGRVLTDLAPHLWEMGALDASLVQDSAAEQQQNPTNFEASLLSLLRNRYDSVVIIM